jgi:hypothetical protein
MIIKFKKIKKLNNKALDKDFIFVNLMIVKLTVLSVFRDGGFLFYE